MKTIKKYFIVNPGETLEAAIKEHGSFEEGYESRSAAALDRDMWNIGDPKAKIVAVSYRITRVRGGK